ncbi:uncharacterized protein LOC135386467 [Ornithodoros turicata]|uniref:uncharacterized protein LOC135386467 n=1 Tax=Ornithodoros turicata TaxID=34597 RepID=UPI003139FBD0
MAGGGKNGKAKGKRTSSSAQQGPVRHRRIHRLLRKGKHTERVGSGVLVYLAAVLEDCSNALLQQKTRIIPVTYSWLLSSCSLSLTSIVSTWQVVEKVAKPMERGHLRPHNRGQFAIGRIHRLLRKQLHRTVGSGALVYLAARLEGRATARKQDEDHPRHL